MRALSLCVLGMALDFLSCLPWVLCGGMEGVLGVRHSLNNPMPTLPWIPFPLPALGAMGHNVGGCGVLWSGELP